MLDFNCIRYNVYLRDEDGLRVIGEGLSPKKAIQLVARTFGESRWASDCWLCPVPGHLYRDPVLQRCATRKGVRQKR